MPQGFHDVEEPQLHKTPPLLDPEIGRKLQEWWLAIYSRNSKTPNLDIASTCTVGKRNGLLLVEAKAHDSELRNEVAGKRLKPRATADSRRNHVRIGACIKDASQALTFETGLPWALSHERHYQMANRFAWSCKLTELGVPVILVYLGFRNAAEMQDQGQPFADTAEWDRLVRSHSEPLFPEQVWNKQWTLHA
jgi:hypothetical protein